MISIKNEMVLQVFKDELPRGFEKCCARIMGYQPLTPLKDLKANLMGIEIFYYY